MSRIATSRPTRSTSAGGSGVVGRQSLLIGLAGILVLLGAAFALGGTDALVGAAVGVALVAAFLLSGRLPFLVDAQLAPGLAYLVLGINYLFRVVLLLVALVALKDQTWLDARALGVVVITGALVWNAMVLRRHLGVARNTTSEVMDGKSPDVNSEETTTDSSESSPSGTRTVGGGR
ncbi:hypothetical protein SAMN05443668_101105 [Cryptosporangium aurantiacum]|uniref:ATP synthase protein I n=2 Tax=Cryptosporangium aurantiacum TaxID=134849 RepID=A0A1M7H8Q4_9ACTN|nr:hypothetical protein SAMN05443668_101105 [Cryptosporangium aurantiacum]